jgi:hypothetical protein
MRACRLEWWAFAALSLACAGEPATEPPAAFPHAAAWPECGPADGAAVTIYLATEPFTTPMPALPYVRIAVWQPARDLPGRTWTLTGDRADGDVAYCSATDLCVSASAGTVTIQSLDADTTITGSADLIFGSRTVTGGFSAEWLPRRFHVASRRCGV